MFNEIFVATFSLYTVKKKIPVQHCMFLIIVYFTSDGKRQHKGDKYRMKFCYVLRLSDLSMECLILFRFDLTNQIKMPKLCLSLNAWPFIRSTSVIIVLEVDLNNDTNITRTERPASLLELPSINVLTLICFCFCHSFLNFHLESELNNNEH